LGFKGVFFDCCGCEVWFFFGFFGFFLVIFWVCSVVFVFFVFVGLFWFCLEYVVGRFFGGGRRWGVLWCWMLCDRGFVCNFCGVLGGFVSFYFCSSRPPQNSPHPPPPLFSPQAHVLEGPGGPERSSQRLTEVLPTFLARGVVKNNFQEPTLLD